MSVGFLSLVTLLLVVGLSFLVNPNAALAGGLSPERAARRAEGHAELLLACCAAMPWVALVSVYVLAVRASFALGHWPRPMINDPKSFGWPVQYAFSYFLANTAFLSVLAIFALLGVLGWRDVRPAHGKAWFLVFAFGYALLWCQMLADPVTSWSGSVTSSRSSMGRQLTSPCSRRAAARRHSRREPSGPRPAAEGQLVRPPAWLAIVSPALMIGLYLALCGCASGSANPNVASASPPEVSDRAAVYSAVLAFAYPATSDRHVVVLSQIKSVMPGMFGPHLDANERWQDMLAEQSRVTDVVLLPGDPNVHLLSAAEYHELFMAPDALGWSGIQARYPGAEGLVELSAVGFDASTHSALVLATLDRGPSMSGKLYAVVRLGGEWVVSETGFAVEGIA